MPRSFTRAQALENQAFVRALRRSGNIRLAARETGLKYGTIQYRRARHPAFAHAMAAALAFAAARFEAKGAQRTGNRPHPNPSPEGEGLRGLNSSSQGEGLREDASPEGEGLRMDASPAGAGLKAPGGKGLRTRGGEAVVVRGRGGTLQMRRAQPGKLTRACEQAFLAALSATANVRLSAAAAGAAPNAFYRRRRTNPAFAREMRLALETGYGRIELALVEGASPGSYEDDAWRRNDPPPIPPMSVNQALQLMYLHQKEARLGGTPAPMRRRPGEPRAAVSMRLALLHEARIARDREAHAIAEAERLARRAAAHEVSPPALPDLAQATGWSRAARGKGYAIDREGGTPRHPDRALFGGWRIADMEKSRKRRGG